MRRLNIIIIDDEPAIRQILESVVTKAGHTATLAEAGEIAYELLGKGGFDVALCDIRMPGMSGIELVEKARSQGIDTAFIMITAFASVDSAIEAMRIGAYDYLVKPVRPEEILRRLEQLASVLGMKAENQLLRQEIKSYRNGQCELDSPAMQKTNSLMKKVAITDSTVLITGASGTGKSEMAKRIHEQSPRANAPFISVNCGAIPENLLESEFFGHTKGAFTGASKAKRGLFLEADQGTIFLDEIGDLPLPLQVKLLQVLEERQIRPLGSETVRPIDIRVIAATNHDLEAMVKDKLFREDLYFRLNVFNLVIPPLSERKEDIITLAMYFAEQLPEKLGLQGRYELTAEALDSLCHYNFPGNVRELHNIMSRAVVLADNRVIDITDLPDTLVCNTDAVNDNALLNPDEQSKHERDIRGSLRKRVKEFERRVILDTVAKCDGDRKRAAKELDIALSSLYRKLDEAVVE